jgi:hypothetical protein
MADSARAAKLRQTLVKVLTVQVVTLIVLAFLQAAFHR